MNSGETQSGQPGLYDLQAIDAVCDRFEEVWRTGRRPDLAGFLSEVPVSVRGAVCFVTC